MLLALKHNAAAGYKGPVKIELLKGTNIVDFLGYFAEIAQILNCVLTTSLSCCSNLRMFFPLNIRIMGDDKHMGVAS